MIQESQWPGKVLGYFKKTHIALISKKQVGCPFEDFKPITYCNTIYKILGKVMAPCLEPILSEVISKEQSGFFQGRQIHDAVEIAQESIHLVQIENLSR